MSPRWDNVPLRDTGAAYQPRARLADERTRRSIQKGATSWVQLPIGTVTNGQRATYDGVYTFGTYATNGVTIPGTSGAVAVAMQPWTNGTGTLYFFQFVPLSGRMKVTDDTGTEIANGTNLAAIASHPFRAVLSSVLVPGAQSRLTGGGRVLGVELEVGAAFTGGGTNFWTFTAYLRRVDMPRPQTAGERLGFFSTEKRSLVALTAVPLYSNETGAGELFADSDRIIVAAAATGNPAPLFGVNAWAQIARSLG